MIRTAKKAELVQVAHNLLDPLMESVHQDVSNLRAELMAAKRERDAHVKQVEAIAAARDREIKMLRAELTGFKQKESEYRRILDGIKHDRIQMKVALAQVQKTQGKQMAEIRRLASSLGTILGRLADE